MPTAVLINSGGRVVFCNTACLELFGATNPAEVVGRTPFELFHPDYHQTIRHRIASMLETGQSVPGLEEKVRRLDGREVLVHVVATPITDRGQSAVLVCLSDLTDRERSMELLRSVLGSVTDAILTIDDAGTVQSANPATERLFGYTTPELIGRNINALMPEPYHHEHDGYIANYLRTGTAKVIGIGREVTGQRKDGTTFPLDLTVTEFQLAGERRFTGVLRDSTARKRLEDQFHQAQKMEAIGQLAGGVAHDFNNLLTVINGYADLLMSTLDPDDPRKAQLGLVQEAGERAAGLTAQLLAFSRKTVIEPKILDLNELVEQLGRMLRRLIGEDVAYITSFAPGVSRVRADPGQLEQVLLNLAINSRDAMPRGGRLTVETSEVTLGPDEGPALPPGRYVRLAVSDTGCGMPPEVVARIFEPFFTTKGPNKGTGLGLATVYGIVAQAGGHVGVESTVGKGTTFTVYLPSVPAPATGPHAIEPAQVAPRGTETILLVEDEDGVRRLGQIALEMQGYTVIAASNAADALAALDSLEAHAGPIDLLVTDVIMPDMGGRDLAEAVRARRGAVRVLFMSGYTGEAVGRYGIEEATDAFLQKPFTPLLLARKVRQTLDKT